MLPVIMQSVYLKNGAIELRETSLPERPPDFALVQVLFAGICNTDLELQCGYYGFSGTPGHEFVGKVVEADSPEWIGRRVVGEINLACGVCEWCQAGFGRHCPTRTVLGIVRHPGAFAQYLTLPERNLHEVPDEISDKQAVFIEPLAAACEILDQVRIPTGARVAVLGDGKLGLLIAQVLHSSRIQVVQFGKHAEKLKISAACGIETRNNEKLPVKEFEFVVDASGSTQGLQDAVRLVRPRGTIVLKSTVHGEVPVNTAPIIVDEVTLVGSRCGRFAPALALLQKQQIQVEPLLSAEFPLTEAEAAFGEASLKGKLKVLLRPS